MSINKYGEVTGSRVDMKNVFAWIDDNPTAKRLGITTDKLFYDVAENIANMSNELYNLLDRNVDRFVLEIDVVDKKNISVSIRAEETGWPQDKGPRYLPQLWKDIQRTLKNYGKVKGDTGKIEYYDDTAYNDYNEAIIMPFFTVDVGVIGESRKPVSSNPIVESYLRRM